MNLVNSNPKSIQAEDLLLPLNDLAHLFNAPRIEPLSPGPLEGLGISGFDYLLSLLHLNNRWKHTRTLTLLLPAEKAAATSVEQVTIALRRHAQWRIERELRDMHNTYDYGWKVAGFAIGMLVTCLALSSLFAIQLTEWMSPLVRESFEYGLEIIGWVILWHPIDVLVFSPVANRARLTVLQSFASLEIVVRAEPTQGSN